MSFQTIELEKNEVEALDRAKFANLKLIRTAVLEKADRIGGLTFYDIPSRAFFLRKSTFPASRVTVAISLDGQRLEVRWEVRERIGGLVAQQSETFQLRYNQDGRLYFCRSGEQFCLQEISRLIASLADRF
jgi:hypothetical protein